LRIVLLLQFHLNEYVVNF